MPAIFCARSGMEMTVLQSVPWKKLSFSAVLVENNEKKENAHRKIDYFMSMRGFAKFHELAVDSLYVPRGGEPVWYPEGWDQYAIQARINA